MPGFIQYQYLVEEQYMHPLKPLHIAPHDTIHITYGNLTSGKSDAVVDLVETHPRKPDTAGNSGQNRSAKALVANASRLELQPPVSKSPGEMLLSNLVTAINLCDQKAVSTLIQSAPKLIAKKLMMSAHTLCFRDTLDNKHFFFMETALRLFPEKSFLFTLFKENEGSKDPHRTILSPSGVEKKSS